MNLEKKEWKEFLFPEVFEIKKGYYNKKPISSGNGKIPFLSATQFNNGVSEFYTISDINNASKTGDDKNNHSLEEKIFKGNCIAVTNNGSVGYAFYQKTDFTCSHDINPLYLKNYALNPYLAKFLIATIEKQRVCFEYARKWRPMRMVKSKILLPTNSKGKPDFVFMESFVKDKETHKIKKYKKYLNERLQLLKDFKPVEPIENKEWKEFTVSELFNNKIGKSIDANKVNRTDGNIAYITRKESNNGLDGFINYDKDYLNTVFPVITIGNETAEPFVQNFEFFTGTKVNILKPKKKISKFVLSFIATSLKQHKTKYSYSFTINSTRLKKQIIILPINDNKEPDFGYMENYMKQLEFKKLNEYLKMKS